MVNKLLEAPVSFFDKNSSGTIVTRFSKDMSTTDVFLPYIVETVLINGYKILILLIFFPMYFVRTKSLLAQNDAKRIEGISKGPINSLYSSVFDGISSIRVYDKQPFFINKFMNEVDNNSSAKFTLNGLLRWTGLRLDLLAGSFVLISIFIITTLVGYTEILNKSIAALSIQF